MRPLRELLDVPDPAWPALAAKLLERHAGNRILPIERAAGEQALHRLQVTARSTLGALALHTGGLAVQHGWLRILGGGGHGLPGLVDANGLAGEPAGARPGLLLVAFDVLGGRFALNGGDLPGGRGELAYWAPDSLQWEPMGLGHTDFVHWSLSAGLGDFYADLRWEGWEQEVSAVPLDHGLALYPPLGAKESAPIGDTSRRPVPWAELVRLLDDLAAAIWQHDDAAGGRPV